MQEVYNYLNNRLPFREVIVVAVSGGPDSMALLHILKSFVSKKELKIIVAHVNHGVRNESEEEKVFVENYCAMHNLEFEYLKIEKYTNDKFSEVEARHKRYDFFENIMKKYHSNYLFTAHHGDDLIETVLMRLVRGSTLKGYGGFKIESSYKGYTILRPLIMVTKDDIMEYLDENKLEYVIDKTNQSNVYTRNRYRKDILPILKRENRNVHLKFKQFSEILDSYDEFVLKVAKEILSSVFINEHLLIDPFLKQEEVIQRKILYLLLEDIYKDEVNILSSIHIDYIFELLANKRNNGLINLPGRVIVYKEYGYLKFVLEKEWEEIKKPLLDKNDLENNHIIEVIKETDLDNNFICRLSKDEVKFPLFIRNRRNGDRMNVKGMEQSKKLSDIFINSKIPVDKRYDYPIVVDSNDIIVWIPGIKKSKFDRTKDEKYDIILKYY